MDFLRRSWDRYVKLGRRRKKNQKWRRPTGRDNKMREKRRGYPKVVSIGYQKDKAERQTTKIIYNLKDLEEINKKDLVIIAKVGKKKRMEIEKTAKEKGIKILNEKKIKKSNKEDNKK